MATDGSTWASEHKTKYTKVNGHGCNTEVRSCCARGLNLLRGRIPDNPSRPEPKLQGRDKDDTVRIKEFLYKSLAERFGQNISGVQLAEHFLDDESPSRHGILHLEVPHLQMPNLPQATAGCNVLRRGALHHQVDLDLLTQVLRQGLHAEAWAPAFTTA